jgi:signal transduction histidine kinase
MNVNPVGRGEVDSMSAEGFALARANKAIEQFIYSCSHSLRAPLKSIEGLLFLLNNSATNKDIDPKLYLASIEKTVNKMDTLLDELEQFLLNSRLDLNARPVHATEVVDQVLREFNDVILGMQVHVTVCVDQRVPFFTDENRLRIMLKHLISNAVAYQDFGKQEKKINIRFVIDYKACVLEITDNGIGIKEGIRDQIFHLFYRGSEQSTGTGVGLYIVQEMITKMGGNISVNSVHGGGSTFLISMVNLSN